MSSGATSNLELDIAHVLFVDIVGYSKLLIHEQTEQLQKLREIARETEPFRTAQAEGKLLRLPTGDGGALVFRTNPEAPVACAIEISRALKNYPTLRVRMGIHSGPVRDVIDLDEQANIAGAGINIAQRVMDCGDAGHVLLSKRVADDLEQYARWRPLLHDLGTCEVKHGAKIAIVNLYSDEIGNPETPNIFKVDQSQEKKVAPVALAPRKSIAVLPFENLSEDKANAYFADGIQEEILTRLSRIADLKVISRTSTQRFRSSPDDIPQIARQLGVANILEGTVQRAGDQVRVNVQLIDAQNDSHLWAERYDRQLTDIFAVESDIAAKIAEALQARLTGAERRAIASLPTQNTEAHQLYLKGRFQWKKFFAPGYERVREYFEQAIALDPSYAPAYTGLSGYHAFGAANGILPPAESWPRAEEGLRKSRALDDTLAETYNLQAGVELYYKRNWPAAERAFRHGMKLDPNFADIPHHYALCLALFERNEEALAEMERAAQLDPFFPGLNLHRGRLSFFLRDYEAAIKQFAQTLELHPSYAAAHEYLGDACAKKGMSSEAITQWTSALVLSGETEQARLLEQTCAKSGFDAAVSALAQAQLQRWEEKKARGEYVPAMNFLMSYIRLGDDEQAFAWLERTVNERNWFALEIRVNPNVDRLRTDPRFEALVSPTFPEHPLPPFHP
ncbi:adenylate/guanylate cyclase domain-containing protein [soil metagenome]